ncbi:MAG: hypothetical protein HYX22_02715 [Candidatus Yanofskybacteria bacterium]|nr:hypothetical protein [Candidatus Yanofskybacteria bacterium]
MSSRRQINKSLQRLSAEVPEVIARSKKIDPIRDKLKEIGFLPPIFVGLSVEFQRHSKHSMFVFKVANDDLLLQMNSQFPPQSLVILQEYAKVAGRILASTQSVVDVLNKLTKLGYTGPLMLCVSGQALSK